jgi:hypothetical protein
MLVPKFLSLKLHLYRQDVDPLKIAQNVGHSFRSTEIEGARFNTLQ